MDGPAGSFGVYRARIEYGPREDAKRARALVYAALPDRIHVEVVSAVGTTHAILDAGAGRLAITVPRERVSYVGEADERAVAALIGLRVSPEALVQALLTGRADGLELERKGVPGGLPERLRVRADDRTLDLRLRSFERVRADASTLGTGTPPAGMALRPLEDLLEDPSPVRRDEP